MIDVIIVSNGKTPELREMTQRAVDSAKQNVFVMEQTGHKYENCRTIHYIRPFNYNGVLNEGIRVSGIGYANRYVALCNNDVLFHDGWAEEMIKQMEAHEAMSASPNDYMNAWGHAVDEGYEISVELKGYCIVCDRRLFDIIGKLDEGVDFWYSDHIYADQLIKNGVKHILCLNARVEHLVSKTINEAEDYEKLTNGQREIYEEARKKYL
jgi:GT2 family glycosyltransferase